MNQDRPPLITVGQVYLNETLNEYFVVTKNNRGHISYQGPSFRGQMADDEFIDLFPPVDPEDVSSEEQNQLLQYCGDNISLKTGFIKD